MKLEAVGGTGGAKLIRIANAGACKYCQSLAGTYNYPNEPEGVFSRHRDCRCIMRFVPFHKGYTQDVWSKKIIDTSTEPELPKGALHIDGVPKAIQDTLRQSPSGVVLKGVSAYYISEANRAKKYEKERPTASMYGIISNSKYKGKKYKVVGNGKKVYFYLDENRTLIYSPSGQYFRIQDKRVLEKVFKDYVSSLGEIKAKKQASLYSYITLNGNSYIDLKTDISRKHKNLDTKELNNLIENNYRKVTHYKDEA